MHVGSAALRRRLARLQPIRVRYCTRFDRFSQEFARFRSISARSEKNDDCFALNGFASVV